MVAGLAEPWSRGYTGTMKKLLLLSAVASLSLCASSASAALKACRAFPFSETPFPASGRCQSPKEKCATPESKGNPGGCGWKVKLGGASSAVLQTTQSSILTRDVKKRGVGEASENASDKIKR